MCFWRRGLNNYDRISPQIRAQHRQIEVDTGETLAESGNNIINAALAGGLAPEAAAQLMGVLSAQTKIIESTELEARITALEVEK